MTEKSLNSGELCRDCQRPLPSGAAQGFCPHCMFAELDETLGDNPAAIFESVPLRNMGGYELLEVIGRGGMGTVYRAQHPQSGEDRALKMISAGELASPAARRRFLQEAGAAAALQHPGIVTIHETGSQDGMPFYVMDYVPGRTLADAVREKPMPPHAAAACMAKVAAAVQHAHEHGVLHRDLKPSNILLDGMEEPRVTDFGLARHLGSDSSLTGSQQILGSPAYMSPEQAAGKSGALTPAVDVYALGAVLYHLLAGRPPFQGESPQHILRQVSDSDPVTLRRINPAIPRELETVTLKCLEKNPARRYPSAIALEQELMRWLQGEPVLARPLGFGGKSVRWVQRNPVVATLSVLLLAGSITGLGVIIHSNRQLRQRDAEKSTVLTEKEATLAESLLWQAEFQRLTGKPGQREGSLNAVREAIKLPLTAEQRVRARSAAISALSLPDAKFVPQPELPVPVRPELAVANRYGVRYACASTDGKVTIVDITTGKVEAVHDLAPRRIDALLHWSIDGHFLAYRYDGTKIGVLQAILGPTLWSADIWASPAEATANQVIFQPYQPNDLLRPWRFMHPDKEGNIIIREAISGFVLHRLPPSPGLPPAWSALSYSLTQNRLAAASRSRKEIIIWNMEKSPPEVERTLPCRAGVESLDWENQENWLLAGDSDGRVTAWNSKTWEPQPPFEGHTQPVVSIVSGDVNNYRHISAASDGTVRLWDRTAYRPVLTLSGSTTNLCLNRAETRVGPVSHDGKTGWYELHWSSALWTLNPSLKSEGIRMTTSSQFGYLTAALTGNGVVVWKTNPPSGHHIILPQDHPAGLMFTPDSNWLAVAAADGLYLHRAAITGRDRLAAPVNNGTRRILTGNFSDICFNQACTLAAVVHGDTGTLELRKFDAAAGAVRDVFYSFPGSPAARCAFSPDGKWLATGSPGGTEVRIIDAATGSIVAQFTVPAEAGNWLPAFSPDSAWLVLSGRTAHLFRTGAWDAAIPVPIPPNQSAGCGAVFLRTRDRGIQWLAVTGADEEVHLFRVADPPVKLAVLRAPQGGTIGWMCVNSIGTVACAAPKGEVQLWPLRTIRRELEKFGLGME